MEHKEEPQLEFNEQFTFNNQPAGFSVGELWKWNGSNLLTHTYRGAVAEYLVHKALGVDTSTYARYVWNGYDVLYKYNNKSIKLEIKTSGFIEGRDIRTSYNKPVFRIAQTHDCVNGKLCEPIKRWLDIYVFCLFAEKNPTIADAMKLEQWEFYTLPTSFIDSNFKNQKTLSLGKLQSLTNEGIAIKTNYSLLKEAIDSICQQIISSRNQ